MGNALEKVDRSRVKVQAQPWTHFELGLNRQQSLATG